MHVRDLMQKEIVLIDKDQNVQDALKLMKKHKISRLPVINTNIDHVKELVGVITSKDIAIRLGSSRYGNMAPSHFHVSTVMTPDPITVESIRSIGNAAEIMMEKKIGGLPVVDEGQVVGIVTKTDFIETCQGRPFHDIKVEEIMTKDLITINPQERLVHARRLILDDGIGRLPVVDDDILEGIITAKDIARSMISFRKVVPDKYKSARIRNLLVEDVMTQNVTTISGEQSIEDTTRMMIENDFSGMPVVDDGHLVGIITKTDLIKLIVELEEVY